MKNNINHIAFIMDGNRRWAVKNGLPKMKGHTQGLENFKNIVNYCGELKIPNVTFWALSTDNLKKRDKSELMHLFELLGQLRDYMHELVSKDAKIQFIGDLSKLPAWLRSILLDVQNKTKDHKSMTITLAVNYGGHDELVRMVKNAVKKFNSPNQVSEKSLNSIIDSGILPPVDLTIRTGGHLRLSGFLPWLLDYSELYFTNKMWPEFKKADLNKAILFYNKSQRNFGK